MSHTSGSTSSPIPISPFSPSPFSANSDSHYTSDDQPDLGAFRTVLREWVHLQPPPRIPVWAPSSTTVSHTQTQTQTHTSTGTDTEGQRSTVWNQRPIADYLQVSLSSVSRVEDSDSDSDIESIDGADTDTDTEGARTVEIETEDRGGSYTPSPLRTQQSLDDDSQSLPVDGIDDRDEHAFAVDDRSISMASTLSSLPLQLRRLSLTPPLPDPSESSLSERSFYESARSSSPPRSQLLAEAESISSFDDLHTPSLGYLDEALSFIAAERARWTAQREAGEWRHVIEPSSTDGEHRRKRRKKRGPPLDSSISISSDETLSIGRSTARLSIASENYSDDEEWARTSLSKSTPTTPRARSRTRPARPTIVTAIVTATPSSTPHQHDPRPSTPDEPTTITITTTSPQKSKTKKTKKLKHRSKPASDPPRIQILMHSRSTPSLRNLAAEEETTTSASAPTDPPRPRLRLRSRSKPPPGVQLPPVFPPAGSSEGTGGFSGDTERGRLVRLTRELEVLFPEEREALKGVEGRLTGSAGGERGDGEGTGESSTSARVGGAKGNKRKRGKRDEGEASGDRHGDTVDTMESSDDNLDPRGREVREGDPLVHVFIDHSNILIGLLNHLRRHPPNKLSPTQPSTSPTRRRKNLFFPQPQAHIGDPVDGGKDIETLILGQKPKPPKPKPPSTEAGQEKEDAIGKVAETGVGRNGDIQEGGTSKNLPGEVVGELMIGDRGTRIRSMKKEGLGGKGDKNVTGRVSRPLPPIPISAPGATKPTVAHSSTLPSSHATPIPLPSFATAGKIPKTEGSGSLTSSAVALKIFGMSGASSSSAPASTVHLPMGLNTSVTTSTGSLSQDISIASNAGTTNTTPPPSPRKSGNAQSRKLVAKSTPIASSTSKNPSKFTITLSKEDSGGKGDNGGGILKRGVESSGDSSRDGHERSDLNHVKKRPVRHLSHTALALILERGRPITRRVLVTSSPLYQPMDTMERLGYEVRVYIRVPDLGDGMDRDRHKSFSGHRRRHSGGGSGTANASSGGSPKKKAKEHARRISGTTIAEVTGNTVGVGEPGPKNPTSPFTSPILDLSPTAAPGPHHHHYHLYEHRALGHQLHPLFPHHEHVQHHQPSRPSLQTAGAGTGSSAPPRVRYREQGVDELLQLKLHQALAAVDDVPEGATIVLATGDGNVGQFNEDGFLGPVRTALKRGWKVELYAWEDGLSRSWKREFGEGSEWGKSGMFRIIGMEQFAQSLVKEVAGVDTTIRSLIG